MEILSYPSSSGMNLRNNLKENIIFNSLLLLFVKIPTNDQTVTAGTLNTRTLSLVIILKLILYQGSCRGTNSHHEKDNQPDVLWVSPYSEGMMKCECVKTGLIPNFGVLLKPQPCGNTIFYYILERFSNDCRKTKTKATTPTNHNRSSQRDEPITNS